MTSILTLVLVVGDVNSTVACGLVAVKMGVKLAHVEAGLRSFDRTMPEEINRVLTDQISDYLFITEASARDNLVREGESDEDRDFLRRERDDRRAAQAPAAGSEANGAIRSYVIKPRGYVLVTLHRPSNVDDRGVLTGLTDALRTLAERLPVVFPVHPRTRQRHGRIRIGH